MPTARPQHRNPNTRWVRETRPTTGICVDASCVAPYGVKQRDGYFHGRTEWRGMDIETGEILFESDLHEQGTVNIGEYLAIVYALEHLYNKQDTTMVVYSDSKIAIGWFYQGRTNTKLPCNEHTRSILNELAEAQEWLEHIQPKNKVRWWNKHAWGGEVPADYGRK